ncbi:PucR family transcriptional regulator [Rhodococcus sp. T2V]|uniref:PucR family transcriptional regulator n=1 Tax=Rhodococcus sp. T2V TaxID=3034164 RepID=UPI0023E0CFE9|nr:helix-turn-helix domain-containing protein [Rhodococcus sp. T2V]MDF3304495.1 helix-turn-helix domain-containing protein [Rhodococcus sp. T2V]
MTLDEVVTEVAERLSASVVLVDRAFSLIAYSTQSPGVDRDRVQSILTRSCAPEARAWYESFGIADSTRPVTTPENRQIEASSRICLPARYAGSAYGYLFVLPDENSAVSDGDLTAAMSLAGQAGAQLAHTSRGRDDMAVAVADLLEGDRKAFARAITRIEDSGLFPDGGTLTVLAVDGLLPAPGTRSLLAPIGSLTAVMVPAVDGAVDPVRSVAESGAGAGALVGVGASYRGLRWARRSWQQAKLGVRVARHDESTGPIAYWEELGIYRLASCGPTGALADAVLTPSVRALLDHRNVDLLATAQTYLDRAGDTAATAAILGIHRQTLYYRLAKIEEVTGLDLSVGAQRLELHVGLTLGRFIFENQGVRDTSIGQEN